VEVKAGTPGEPAVGGRMVVRAVVVDDQVQRAIARELAVKLPEKAL
jgi:hypothetical protein